MTNPRWDPTIYEQYGNERALPYFDLMARVNASEPARVFDLGCGPGTQTVLLAERWPEASVVGLDLSREMIEAARTLDSSAHFEVADIEEWMPPADADVLISNATLQWIPEHRELLVRWAAALKPGAWLAFQVPGNFSAPSHALMRMLADSPRWRAKLDGVLRPALVGSAAEYLGLLEQNGIDTHAWETTYLHVLHGENPVLDWMRGTGLRPVLEALGDEDGQIFETEYRALLAGAYIQEPHGVVFPFRRIFCVGRKR